MTGADGSTAAIAAETEAAPPRPNRRALFRVVLLGIAGGVLATVVAGRDWAQAEAGQAPMTQKVSATGGDLSGAVSALGLAGIAGALALLATARWGRVLVGLLMVASGAGVAVGALDARSVSHAAKVLGTTAGTKGVGTSVTAVSMSPWPYVAVAAGLIVAAAGLVAVVRGQSWPGLSSRYDAPAARQRQAAATARAHAETPKGLWDALDRGEDPTAQVAASVTPGIGH